MTPTTDPVVAKLMNELHDLRNEVKALRALVVMRDGEIEHDELPGLSLLMEFTIALARDGWHGEIECQVSRHFFARLVEQAISVGGEIISFGSGGRPHVLRVWGPTGRVTVVPGDVPDGCIWPVRPGMQVAPQSRGHVFYTTQHEIDAESRTMTLTSVRYDLVQSITAIEVKP